MKSIEELMQDLNKKGWQTKLIKPSEVCDYRDCTGALFDDQGLIESNWLSLEWMVIKELFDNRALIKPDMVLYIYV